jgi:SH3-like domain-containing protein
MPAPHTPSWANPSQGSARKSSQGASGGTVGLDLGGLMRGKIWWLALGLVVFMLGWLIVHLPETAEAQGGAFDTPSSYPVPRWVTIRSSKVFARKGPSKDHDVLWVYTQKGLPVQVISETREWRLICDPDGAIGWVRHDMVSSRRAVMATFPGGTDLRAGPDEKASLKGRLKARTLAGFEKCEKGFCQVRVVKGSSSTKGWVAQSALWGTQATPACKRPGL